MKKVKRTSQVAKTDPKDIFLHLLSILALYMSVISLIWLWFSYIYLLFDNTVNQASEIFSIRWFITLLVVAFPVYFYTRFQFHRDDKKYPQKKEIRLRRWLNYLTQFLVALVISGDLIALIYSFLQGDLTLIFLLKVLAIFIIGFGVFYYYSRDIRQGWAGKALTIFTSFVVVILLVTYVYGFSMVGSPFKARQEKLDNERINDLSLIQSQIISYWVQKKQLPNSLNDLTNNITGAKAPQDPVTNKNYDYQIKSPLSFQLCATFDSTTDKNLDKRWEWQHPKGHFCFTRTIDPDLYKNK